MDSPDALTRLKDLGLRLPPSKAPRILFFDIETAPALAWVWSAFDTNIIATEQDWYLLSVAYKWRGARGIDFKGLIHDPDFVPDSDNDLFVAKRLAALLDAADIVVAHNGDKFDRRKTNARLLFHGILPPSPYQTVDTLKVSRREFDNYSNSLKEIARRHGLGEKVPHHGFDLWRACMAGDAKSWRLMERYNRQDIRLLEGAYDLMLPWMGLPGKPGHPNMGHWAEGKPVCGKCGSADITKNGFHYTLASKFQTYECGSCGGFTRGAKRETEVPVLR